MSTACTRNVATDGPQITAAYGRVMRSARRVVSVLLLAVSVFMISACGSNSYLDALLDDPMGRAGASLNADVSVPSPEPAVQFATYGY